MKTGNYQVIRGVFLSPDKVYDFDSGCMIYSGREEEYVDTRPYLLKILKYLS